jgi:hypothetical protein
MPGSPLPSRRPSARRAPCPPAALTSSAACRPRSSLRLAITTRAPSRASTSTIPRPMPVALQMATLPSTRPMLPLSFPRTNGYHSHSALLPDAALCSAVHARTTSQTMRDVKTTLAVGEAVGRAEERPGAGATMHTYRIAVQPGDVRPEVIREWHQACARRKPGGLRWTLRRLPAAGDYLDEGDAAPGARSSGAGYGGRDLPGCRMACPTFGADGTEIGAAGQLRFPVLDISRASSGPAGIPRSPRSCTEAGSEDITSCGAGGPDGLFASLARRGAPRRVPGHQ